MLSVACNAQGEATDENIVLYTADNGTGSVYFDDNTITWVIGGRCAFTCPIKSHGSDIEMFWTREYDCSYTNDLDESFTKTYGVKSPKPGSLFATISKYDDKTITMTYHYPEWVAAYNQSMYDNTEIDYEYVAFPEILKAQPEEIE